MIVRLQLGLLACAMLSGCTSLQPGAEQAMRAVLESQVAAWNRGDVVSFMSGYVTDDRLRFAGASGVQRGYLATLKRYRQTYPTPSAMGKLTFSELEIQPLSGRYAEVFGRYHLRRGGNYKDATGLFTLLFEHTPTGWRILHDHSSALVP